MGLFYQGLGLILMYAGSFFATSMISDYEIPQFPVSVSLALSSGLLEESAFFGIPYYMTSNPHILLGTGIAWSAMHLFSSGIFSLETLSYGGFLFTIPYSIYALHKVITSYPLKEFPLVRPRIIPTKNYKGYKNKLRVPIFAIARVDRR